MEIDQIAGTSWQNSFDIAQCVCEINKQPHLE